MDVPIDVRCYITGTGLASVQGLDVETNWQNLLAGRVLYETGIVALPRDFSLSRVSQLATHAAREALAAVENPPLNDGRTALVVGTSKGPIEDWIDQLNGVRPPDIRLGLSQIAADIAAAFGHSRGPRLTLAGACASGLHALIRARDLIQAGQCDRALVVAAEASTHALFRANFDRLGVLADPAEGCRPFDVRRRGFLLAEAAAAVWLTTEPTPGAIRIDQGVFLADAHHLVTPDQAGSTLRRLLDDTDLPTADLIHAHGTGTVLNDAVEYAVISDSIRQAQPFVYSHKHAVGHTQGAAGLISVVLNAEMHRRTVVLGNSNSHEPLPTKDGAARILSVPRHDCAVGQSVVIAAGFGGTIAAVRLITTS